MRTVASLIIFVVISFSKESCHGVSINDLLPFGPTAGDSALNTTLEDANSYEAALSVPISFFHRKFNSLFINENGMVSFLTEVPSFYNVEFPMDYPIIAPFFADVEVRQTGQVYYRISHIRKDLEAVRKIVSKYFSGARFRASEVVVVTWDQVGGYKLPLSKVNTFQLIIASDGKDSFSIFMYPENGIQWIRGAGKKRSSPDAKAQSGFLSGEGKFHLLPVSGQNQMANLNAWSNTDKPGLWVFKIGTLDLLENLQEPILDSNPVDPRFASNCTLGSFACHSQAECTDTRTGYCCHCKDGWFGDGKNCIEEGGAIRVIGRVSGQLNDISITEQDFHSYVETIEGRAYTAVSRIRPELGWNLQSLTPIGTVISWLFASNGGPLLAVNGFSLTGGQANYSAEMHFPDTNDKASILFHIKGINAFDYLTVSVRVSGSVPRIEEKTQISVEDTELDMTRFEPGIIRARSSHQYGIKGTDKSVPYTIEHTIRWDECIGSQPMDSFTLKLETSNYIIYDEREEIVRYKMTSTIKPLSEREDPCQSAQCGPHSKCLVEGLSYRCACSEGYWDVGQGYCQDIDECMSDDSNNCHQNAMCINLSGSFNCTCKDGYAGDGLTCIEMVSCKDLSCSDQAYCHVNKYGQGECKCKTGYSGDGVRCTLIPSEITLRAFSTPEEEMMKSNLKNTKAPSQASRFSELGPAVQHIFEVTNHGPYDAGHIMVNMSWPLQDHHGNWILYLTETPFVQYSKDSRDLKQRCEIDSRLVNTLDLQKDRMKRQATLYYDEDEDVEYEVGTDSMYPSSDYTQQVGLGSVFEEKDEFDDYDYTHLLDSIITSSDSPVATQIKNDEVATVAQDDGSITTNSQRLSPSERLSSADPQSGDYSHVTDGKFRQVSFLCRLNLAANEAGLITVNARLAVDTLTSTYANAGKIVIESRAQLLENEMAVAKTPGETEASAALMLKPENPVFSQDPGRGVRCEETECHKYAICIFNIGPQIDASCKCPEGFSGDGINDCFPAETPSISCGLKAECGENAHCQTKHGELVCVCNPGYYGDGYLCARDTFEEELLNQESSSEPAITESSQMMEQMECRGPWDCDNSFVCKYLSEEGRFRCVGEDMCKTSEDCGANSVCHYNRSSGRLECKCEDGYRQGRTGADCHADPNAGCDVLRNCDENASCELDITSNKYYCRCQAGFRGNGTICEKDQLIGCNVHNNCGKFASCKYFPSEFSSRCVCDTERGFQGDGYDCVPITHCQNNQLVCDPNADCDRSSVQGHGCKCKPDFFGDGLTCQPVPRYDGNYLLLAQGMAVIKVPLSGKRSAPIKLIPQQIATGIDLDCMKGQVYWTDTTGKLILRSNLDGSNTETFLSGDFGFPEGIAVDWISRNIFITDPGREIIEVIGLDSMNRMKLIDDRLHSPRGIALHPGLGKIYWTDHDRYGPKIEMANMDGSARQVLVNRGLGEPNSIAVDYSKNEVCWTDGGRRDLNIKPKIDCIGALGSGWRTVIELSEGDYPYGIAITDNDIYWTDWNRLNVHRVDKTTGQRQKSIPYQLASIRRPYDLVNIPSDCPYLTNSCQGQPCGPRRMCLPNGNGNHICL